MKIDSIKEIENNEYVYDIELEKNHYFAANKIYSHNCRLKNDFSKVAEAGYQNSFGVGGLSIGSHRVAGLNMPRLAFLERENPNILTENLNILQKILYSHRQLIKDRIDGGFLPLYTTNWIELSRQYSTIGFIGGYEYVANKGFDIMSEFGQIELLYALESIENSIVTWQKYYNSKKRDIIYINDSKYLPFEFIYIKSKNTRKILYIQANEIFDYNKDEYLIKKRDIYEEIKKTELTSVESNETVIFNTEQIPGESMAVRLADIDHILGYNIKNDDSNNDEDIDVPYIDLEKKYELYSNQYIPLIDDASIYDRFYVQGKFDSLTSGGAILHINVDDEKPISKEQFKRLMESAKSLNVVYFAINYAYSECENNHFSVGKKDKCNICDSKIIQQYTRVVGFITPVNSWNETRRKYEFTEREFYKNGALEI